MKDIKILGEIEALLEVQLKSAENLIGNNNVYVLKLDRIVALAIHDNKIIHKKLDSLVHLLNKLKSLKQLRIYGCKISNITPLQELRQLRQLTYLNLEHNQISDITPVKELKQLKHLGLDYNQISDITPLQELKQLTYLNLGHNQISDITPLQELKQLKHLGLDYNQISDITPLQELKQLEYLNLDYNRIKTLSWKLIDFFENTGLMKKGLSIKGNRITEPPLELLNENYQALKDYFEQREKYGTKILYEGKILIVGEAGAGKSTLFKKLQDPKGAPLPDTKFTLGVIVKEGLHLPHPEKSKVEMIANVWDFGGQEIQYNLHQYFITSDALYILVSDNRKQNTQWDYWFHIIELLAGQCTTLVVLNNNVTISSKSDFDKTTYTNRFPKINIVQCDVDFAKNDGKWTALQEEINRLFAELPLVNQPVPAPWVELRNALIEKRNTCNNYISLNDFYQLKTQQAITLEEKKSALDYFRRIGIITHFPEDNNLKNTIFLNPNWITQGLYAAIASDNKDMENGKFSETWIFNFWSKHENKYNETEQTYLLSLMLKDKFDICYELESGKYVIPFMLPAKEPKNIHWEDTDNMGFRIQYPFMPKGILSRLTVQLNEIIENNLVWRDGVIFEDKKHKSRAKVVSDYDAQSGLKYIDIKIHGTSPHSKQELIQKIRDKIEDIHEKSFKGISFTELVPCNCDECKISKEPHYFKMDTILNFLEKKKTNVYCDISTKEVNIDKLIGPVYTGEEIEARMKLQEKNITGNATIIEGDIKDSFLATNNEKSNISQKNKTNLPNMKTKNNPWISGSFYLTVVCVVFAGLATIANFVHWALVPIIFVAGILLILVIGVLQLKNDDRITDKSFRNLVIEILKRLPLIRKSRE